MRLSGWILLALLSLAGCASTAPVLNTEGVSRSPSPQQLTAGEAVPDDTPLLWGGVIVSASNLPQYTQLEVLAYPLAGLRPDTGETPLGRFLIRHAGYLETLDYASGRELSVVGKVTGMQDQRIGEAAYRFPLMEDEQLHLWPSASRREAPRVNFGFGVVLSN
ncbi:Slp family lipoprotein [Granulosicoccaceae sp. 1_MG-2023]|nr:Slp family lipoprotein [Granulosicoccaceae sp. 1_MG-2023]